MRWLDHLYGARDRLLADPRFQRWAAGFPFTRGIARRRASALFDLTAGFVYAQILGACVQLRLLEHLRDGPLTAATLGPKIDLSEDRTSILLKAASALGLVASRGRDDAGHIRYGLGMDGAALLGNPGALAMIAHHHRFYADLADPVALLRGQRNTQLASFWPYAKGQGGGDEESAPYTTLMSASQPLVTADIIEAHDFSRHRSLLDCGGGDGTFLAAVLAQAPSLHGTIFDLPPVAACADARFADAGIAGRATAIGGDLWADPLPREHDAISLVRVLHDHDDERVASLLRRIFAALPPGGTLIIAEPMMTGVETQRVAQAYFGLYFLAMGSGRARSIAEYRDLLISAGFHAVEHVRTRRPLLCSLVRARR